ncbi:MAG: hypothetical protein FWC33_06095 [Candidatus Bathyarchaeota archaeon]|nr:hypothetical protein [Candidatus Termiticorpusculum sp.]
MSQTNNGNNNRKCPFWVFGEPVATPMPGTVLISHKCRVGVRTYIHGYRISSDDGSGNIFKLQFVHDGKIKTFAPDVFSADGTIHLNDGTIINTIYPADSSSDITITLERHGNINTRYYADLLLSEELTR